MKKSAKKQFTVTLFLCFSIFLSMGYAIEEEPQSISIQQKTENLRPNKINLNTASAEELSQGLTMIGLKKAQQIVEYREKYGFFTQVEQLQEVPGVGAVTVEKNRDRLTL